MLLVLVVLRTVVVKAPALGVGASARQDTVAQSAIRLILCVQMDAVEMERVS